MARPAIGYGDLIPASTVSASSAHPNLPAAHLKTPHLTEPWRSADGITSAYILADLGSSKAVGWVALLGCNLSAAGQVRTRLSTVDATGAAGNAYNVLSNPAGIDPTYGRFVHRLAADPVGRYLRLDLSDGSLPYLEVGALCAGTWLQSTISSMRYGWSRKARPMGSVSRSPTGQMWSEEFGNQLGWQMEFGSFTRAEHDAHLTRMQRLTGLNSNILLWRDPDSLDFGADTIVGTLEQTIDISQRSWVQFGFAATVWERL